MLGGCGQVGSRGVVFDDRKGPRGDASPVVCLYQLGILNSVNTP